MTKEDFIRKMINHEQRGEDALWIADTFSTGAIKEQDAELGEAARLLMEGSERLYQRLYELNDELKLGIDMSY